MHDLFKSLENPSLLKVYKIYKTINPKVEKIVIYKMAKSYLKVENVNSVVKYG